MLSRLAQVLVAATMAATRAVAQTPTDSIPAHDTLSIASRALGERRPINVHLPVGYSAKRNTRFPVLYMPDGALDEDFPHVVNTVDSLIALGRIRPVIVVGIPNTQRRRDLTGPTRVHEDSAIALRVGGSAAFRRFVTEELVPAIDRRYRTTRERGIVGESLAGLFIVETFLRTPTQFDHYVAFDPSVWWNRGALVDSASALLRKGSVERRSLYVSVSSDGIGERSSKLADALESAVSRGLDVTFVQRRDETHPTIFRAELPTALVRALR